MLRLPVKVSSGLAAFFSSAAIAAPFGVIRPLQHGPIGDSPQFTELGKYDAEAAVSLERHFGKLTRNGDPDTKVTGSDLASHVMVGGGMMPSKTFGLTAYIDFQLISDADEEQTRVAPKTTLDMGHYHRELALFGFFKPGPLVIGGGLGVVIIGAETREFVVDGSDKFISEVSSAAMPTFRLFGGITSKSFDGTLGLRIFSMGEAVVEADADGTKYEYDVVRRNPGEVHVDAKIKLGQAAIAASIAYVLTGQASEQIDEFSTRFVTESGVKRRTTGDDRRNADHVRVGFGGRFDPSKMFGIMGGLSYIGASYAKEEYASLEHKNLGGLRLDLGTEVKIQQIRILFNAGYALDATASYTQKDGTRDQTNFDRTARSPINQNDKVKVTQGSFSLMLGGGMTI